LEDFRFTKHSVRMKKLHLLFLLSLGNFLCAQDFHNPQNGYNPPGSLYDLDSLRTLSIQFYDNDYDSILQANWALNNGVTLPAMILLSNGEFYDSVAVRYKGNSTFALPQSLNKPKFPFNIDVNEYVGGQKLMNYKSIKLANAFLDPTFCKEITGLSTYRNYLPSPEVNFMKVNVQGNYLGLYVNTESVNKQFLMKHFNEKDGVFFKCDPIQQFGQNGPTGTSDLGWRGADTALYYNDYDLKSSNGWTELRNLIYTLNFTPELLDSVLNVDRVLWAFAANTVTANLDTYNGLFQHNYYLYQTGDGLFQMIPWDLSESYEGALLGYTQTPDSMYQYDPFQGFNCLNTPLVSRLLADTDSKYAKIYAAHVRTILEENLDSLLLKQFVDQLQNRALSAVVADTNKLFSLFEYYYNVGHHYIIPSVISLGGITSTANIRKNFLTSNSVISALGPTISSVQIINQAGIDYVTATVVNENEVELLSTTSAFNSKFSSSPMYDDGTNGDLVANDQVYTAIVPQQAGQQEVKFYIRAENDNAYKLNPERAEYEFYIYSKSMGIADQSTPSDFLIYPNATPSILNVESKGALITSYQLVSILGEKIEGESLASQKLVLDLSNFARGVYVLIVNNKSYRVIKE
jgi:hypothetical protein